MFLPLANINWKHRSIKMRMTDANDFCLLVITLAYRDNDGPSGAKDDALDALALLV